MLEFLKRLLGLAPKPVEVIAPYKVETTTPVVAPAPVVTPEPVEVPVQADKKAATGAAKSTAKKGTEAGVKPARRHKKPAST